VVVCWKNWLFPAVVGDVRGGEKAGSELGGGRCGHC